MADDGVERTPDADGVEGLCAEFHRLWHEGGTPPDLESFLQTADPAAADTLFQQLLVIDIVERQQRQLTVTAEEYIARFPRQRQMIEDTLRSNGGPTLRDEATEKTPGAGDTLIRTREFDGRAALVPAGFPNEPIPDHIGRYAIERLLGTGGFGRVFLARDTELERQVAIKVPHAHRLSGPADVEAFLSEARTLASLDHPGVVPIYDFGRFEDRCFVVSKYIAGETLSQRMQRAPLSAKAAVELLRSTAETLNFIHLMGVVHRDIKPGNLLLDRQGRCFLTDFGLALRDFNYGQDAGRMGTVNYMSPEQARGEGHLVDGRSDLFSLGVVMYEMLTGIRPFTGMNWQQVVTLICHHEPRPLRHRNQNVPKELERICLKLLAKRASDRYLTAQDLADDLSHFLDAPPTLSRFETPSSVATGGRPLDSQQQLIGIIPRGLRSFDQEDAAFFRELLPGPRDRDGLPDSLRFWKRRIESTDPVESFRVGAVYGPSGCGKSSFVKAGLLPILEHRLTVVFVEADAGDTEQRLQDTLRLRIPDIPQGLTLTDAVAWVRRKLDASSRGKVLIVIDQFEQWLHTRGDEGDSELALALRHCDGEHVQCLLLVRDDFWLALSRLAEEIEVALVPTRNLQMVDLFDKRHARKVLAEYGRAFTRLPDNLGDLSNDQDAFLDEAIDGLAEGGKLIPVQLAAFAEIMKSRDWIEKSLIEIGGTRGVGVRFLEESFSSPNAPAQNRSHEAAVQAVLKSLLPETGANIKGGMRSESELLAISGYEAQPRVFDQLLQILDGELRLITPTDPHRLGAGAAANAESQQRSYQLTHDFLVPAIRSWLNHRQQLTLSGRTSMRLADRTEVWSSRPEKAHLPSWWEWVSFLLLTKPSQRDPNERRMLSAATRKHTLSTVVVLGFVAILVWGGVDALGRTRAAAMAEQLTTASPSEVSSIIDQLDDVHRWSRTPLVELQTAHDIETKSGLHARLALLRRQPDDQTLFAELSDRLLNVDLNAFPLIRDELAKSSRCAALTKRLWSLAEDETADSQLRFRSALALASYDPPADGPRLERWGTIGQFTADQIIQQTADDPRYYLTIAEAIAPSRDVLLPHLRRVYSSVEPSSARHVAMRLLIDLLRDEPSQLADVFLDADDVQLAAFTGLLDDSYSEIRPVLQDAAAIAPNPHLGSQMQEVAANRQVNAAAMLMRHGETDELWELLRHNSIPSTRSGLIERAVALQMDPNRLLAQLPSATNDGVLSALLLMLGTYDTDSLTNLQRDQCQAAARELFLSHPAADVHSAAEWLLRRLGEDNWIERSLESLGSRDADPQQEWTVNPQGQTFVRFHRGDNSFEIGTTEVTIEQFLRFQPSRRFPRNKAPYDRCPAILITWFDATEYCRWLTAEAGLGEDDMCYPPLSAGEVNVQLHENYQTRRGYRLPTVREWETACFGQSETRFYFGHRESLLNAYDWVQFDDRPTVPLCGLKKPSPTGMFDMLGNVSEWCSPIHHDSTLDQRPIAGSTDTGDLDDILRLSHGGVFPPHTKFYSVGLRVARSLPLPPDK